MCLIIYRPAGAKLEVTREMIGHACDANPHGFGLMWADGGRVVVAKYLPSERKAFVKRTLALQAQNVTFAAHMRYATHGTLNRDNVHPFWVRKGRVALMHNGILSIACLPGMSDTRTFVHQVMRALPDNWADNAALWYLVSEAASGSKLLLLDADGRATIVNEKLGHWKDGVWFSGYSYNKPLTRSSFTAQLEDAAKHAARPSSGFALSIPARSIDPEAEAERTRILRESWEEHFKMAGKPDAAKEITAKVAASKPVGDGPTLYFMEGLVLCEACLRMEATAKDHAVRIDAEPGDACELCTYVGRGAA